MTKQQLREIYLAKRLDLSEANYLQFNRRLYELFFSCVDLSFVRVLHTFLPIEGKKEPDTWIILDRIRREFPQIQLSVPRISANTPTLENINFEGLHQIKENSWGIPEPASGVPTPSAKIDLVIVPLLAFDKRGQRVGYGKGYYDRFLLDCRSDCVKLGISFFPPVDVIDDVDIHDQKLDQVISPDQFYQF